MSLKLKKKNSQWVTISLIHVMITNAKVFVPDKCYKINSSRVKYRLNTINHLFLKNIAKIQLETGENCLVSFTKYPKFWLAVQLDFVGLLPNYDIKQL